MKLKPSTKTTDLEKRLGAPDTGGLRSSKGREKYLEKVARMVSKANVRVRLHPGGAKCISPRGDVDTEIDAYILIPEEKYWQTETALPPDAWDLLFQETELFHELGHVLYTSWEALEEVRYDVDNQSEGLFKGLANCIEDGAIETQLANRFNVGDDLTVKNANLASLSDKDLEMGENSEGNSVSQKRYTLREAVEIGLLDMGYYDSGRFAEILDEDCERRILRNEERTRELLEEMVPFMQSVMADCLSEPDGEERMYRILDFWQNVKPYFEQSASEDQEKTHDDGRPEDADNTIMNGSDDADELPDDEQAEEHVTAVILIDEEDESDESDDGDGEDDVDADVVIDSTGSGEGGDDADDGGDGEDGDETAGSGDVGDEGGDESEDAGEAPQGSAGPEQDEGDEIHEGGSKPDSAGEAGAESDEQDEGEDVGADGEDDAVGDSGDDEVEDSEQDDDGNDGPAGKVGGDELSEIEKEIRRKYQEQARNQKSADNGNSDDGDLGLDDAEQYLEIISSGDNDLKQMEVVEPDEYQSHSSESRWKEAVRRGKPLVSILERMLQREREEQYQTERRYGELDHQSLYKVGTGSSRVFRQRRDPDTKDYSCIIILDRSSSMDSRRGEPPIVAAEDATAQLVYALDEVGVDVSVLAMYDEMPSLEIPFNADVERCAERLLTKRTAGTTPLHDMLEVARERLMRGDGDVPFIIVVTDGGPDKKQLYKRQLEKTNCEVWGVYIDNSGNAEAKKKHQQYFDRITYATHDDISRKLRTIAQSVMR